MNCHLRWRLCSGFVLILILATPTGVQAQITNCGAPSQPGFKVYLDKPLVASSSIHDFEHLSNDLYFVLLDRKDDEWKEWLPAGNVKFELCEDRQPSIDMSDFDSQLVDLLYNDDVLVEFVASLRASSTSGSVAHLRFVVVPMRQLHFEEGSGRPDGLFRARVTSDGSQEDFVNLLKQVRDIDTYVAAGFGVKSFRQGNYAAAQKGLCQSLVSLTNDASVGLVELLSELAKENLVSAQSDPAYNGPLKLLDPAQPCPEGLL